MKLTIRKKLGVWSFLGKQPPSRIYPPRDGRAEYHVRERRRKP